MISFLDQLKEKIQKSISAENITIIDNSHFHKKHKSFDPKKFHIKVIVKSQMLKKMNKIDAHRKIFSILSNEMSQKIHALEVEIN
jgi:BolA family transcriptional regulator, general stress-responsive regulator